jgi:uncharacterized membrane protein
MSAKTSHPSHTLASLSRTLARSVYRRCRYELAGLWVALFFSLLSFTPSLLPRSPEFQGLLVGVNAAIGYGFGVLGAWVWREFADRDKLTLSIKSWRRFAVTATVTGVLALIIGERWQRQLRDLIGAPDDRLFGLLLIPIVALLVFVFIVAIARTLRTIYRRLAAWLEGKMGPRAARATGLIVLTLTVALVASGVVWDAVIRSSDASFAVRDLGTPGRVTKPTTSLRSGGPDSLIAWDELGREGRVFTGRGPDAAAISAWSGEEALEPIRTYAGTAAADSTEARADLVVRDLVRAGGFDRDKLLIVTTTGTGWVEPSSVSSFEYINSGDTATVSMQYSHLPSVLAVLVDQDRARIAGRQLFDAVYSEWLKRPADSRPELYSFGESLGSFGGEAAFSGEFDLSNRLSGALFVGPTNFNQLYREFVDERDAGTREVQPIYRDGRTIRFTMRPRDGIPPGSEWTGTRVLYMQHPSDPITWWSPSLMLSRPDWLDEERGRDILPQMRWMPFVTFWQVSADLPLSFSTPPEHGHVFTGEHVDGWAAVLQPEGWTEEKAASLREIILSGGRL